MARALLWNRKDGQFIPEDATILLNRLSNGILSHMASVSLSEE